MAQGNTIEAFKSNMSKGFARPNLFTVEITGVETALQPMYQMSCFQAQIPGHNIATTDKDIGFRSVAYQRIYSDMILGFYVNEKLEQLKYWQHWVDSIIHKSSNQHMYYENYVGEVKVTSLNRQGNKVATWTLHDAYPKQVDPIQLDYGTNDAVMTCNATITYRHFTVCWHEITDIDERGDETYAEIEETDMTPVPELMAKTIEKRPVLLRITQQEFDEMYPNFDRMSQTDQNAVLKLYGKDYIHAESSSGGALHMVNT